MFHSRIYFGVIFLYRLYTKLLPFPNALSIIVLFNPKDLFCGKFRNTNFEIFCRKEYYSLFIIIIIVIFYIIIYYIYYYYII